MAHTTISNEQIESVWFKSELGCSVFNDKGKAIGDVKVCRGLITIKMHEYPPCSASKEASADHLAEQVAAAIKLCYHKQPEAFSPYSI